VVEHQDRFLIGRRGKDVALAGYWEFPGGKVQPGETTQQAAERECLEETGLSVQANRLLLRRTHDYAHATVDLHFFACTLTDMADTQPRPPFAWTARSALADCEFPAANGPLIRLLLETGSDKRRVPEGEDPV